MKKINTSVKIVGAGLAGCEASYFLAEHGIHVELYECKPKRYSPAHTSANFAELVCSNSLKSNDIYGNACGLLKEEMRKFGSITMEAAEFAKIPAGGALAVERDKFSQYITEKIKGHSNIQVIEEEVTSLFKDGYTILASGPLTLDSLANDIKKEFGDGLYFYDAVAPILDADSIDMQYAFVGDRYNKGNGDYINCILTKEEYIAFVEALCTAERATLHTFEKQEVFEGCMPIEVLAKRGVDSLRFAMLKPVGLYDSEGKRPYAVLQLRKENKEGTAYNLVGCQTNLKFAEQRRVFGLIPALKNANFLRYGVMHRNTFINSPKIINADLSCKQYPNIYFAGQITGVEGYVESAASGLLTALQILAKIENKDITWTRETVLGALYWHQITAVENFQPMNANYGILAPLQEEVRDKVKKRQKFAERALQNIDSIIERNNLNRKEL